jgi:tetratricopeptide (TPR) repeat protein
MMKKSSKKKLWFIIIGFFVLMIPISYFVKNSIAIDIHNTAMQKVMTDFHRDTVNIKESINQIDQAIWLYRRNYIFYASKAQLLCYLKKYHEAISTLKQIEKFKDDYAEGYEFEGLIYDKLNLLDSANSCYQKALQANEQRIKDHSNDFEKTKFNRINRAFDIMLLKGKDNAQKELLKLYSDYPNDINVAMFDSTLRTFDKRVYINRYFK